MNGISWLFAQCLFKIRKLSEQILFPACFGATFAPLSKNESAK